MIIFRFFSPNICVSALLSTHNICFWFRIRIINWNKPFLAGDMIRARSLNEYGKNNGSTALLSYGRRDDASVPGVIIFSRKAQFAKYDNRI